MKFKLNLVIICLLCLNYLKAQSSLIVETDSIKIFDTYISENSKENIFPTIYKNGLLYISLGKYKIYKLYYSDLKSTSKKIKVSNKFYSGSTTVFNNEIYFTGKDFVSSNNQENLVIYKGYLEGYKIKKIKKLPICVNQFSYAHPSISKDGQSMVIVSNENGKNHLLELKRTKDNEWKKGNPIFITQSNFDIINPTFFNNNTIYFSTNSSKGDVKEVTYKRMNDKLVVDEINVEKGDFNIFKVTRVEGIWQLPQKAMVFNSEFDDLGVVFISKNKGYLNTFRYDNADNIFFFELK